MRRVIFRRNRKHSKYFLSVILGVCFLGFVGWVSYNLREIVNTYTKTSTEQLEKNLYSSKNIQITVSVDSSGHRINSFEDVMTPQMHQIIIDQSVSKLVGYNEQMADSAKSIVDLIVTWGTVLTLVSVIFTFFGYFEIKNKMRDFEEEAVDFKCQISDDEKIQGYYIDMFDAINVSRYPAYVIRELKKIIDKLKGDSDIDSVNKKNKLLSRLYYYVGKMYDRLIAPSEAKTYYDLALKCNPDDNFARYNRAVDYFETGDVASAASDLEEASKGNETDYCTYYRLGCYYLCKQRYSDAITSFKKANNGFIKVERIVNTDKTLQQLIDDKDILEFRGKHLSEYDFEWAIACAYFREGEYDEAENYLIKLYNNKLVGDEFRIQVKERLNEIDKIKQQTKEINQVEDL